MTGEGPATANASPDGILAPTVDPNEAGGGEMGEPAVRRLYFDEGYALTYGDKGWALLHKDEGLVATDHFPGAIDVPYRDGKTLLEFVREAMAEGRGDPL